MSSLLALLGLERVNGFLTAKAQKYKERKGKRSSFLATFAFFAPLR